MHDTIRAPGRGAQTFLVHLLGGGLADIRYAVTHFRSRAEGDIVPVHPEGSTGKGKPRPSIMTLGNSARAGTRSSSPPGSNDVTAACRPRASSRPRPASAGGAQAGES